MVNSFQLLLNLLALGTEELSSGWQFVHHIVRSLLCWRIDAFLDFIQNLVRVLLVMFRLYASLSDASVWCTIALLSWLLSGAHFVDEKNLVNLITET